MPPMVERPAEFMLTAACTSAEHLLMNESTACLEGRKVGGGGVVCTVLQGTEKFNALFRLASLFCGYSPESDPVELLKEKIQASI